jgi:hypothetical protein
VRKVFEKRCRHCFRVFVIAVNAADWDAWGDGAPLEDTMPYLSRQHRLLLTIGYCETCVNEKLGYKGG